jgi:hypothetical protein
VNFKFILDLVKSVDLSGGSVLIRADWVRGVKRRYFLIIFRRGRGFMEKFEVIALKIEKIEEILF